MDNATTTSSAPSSIDRNRQRWRMLRSILGAVGAYLLTSERPEPLRVVGAALVGGFSHAGARAIAKRARPLDPGA